MSRPKKNPPRKPADPAYLSEIRRAAGIAGVASRWGTARDRATACLRVYERDAAAIRARAKAAHTLPADVIMELMRNV